MPRRGGAALGLDRLEGDDAFPPPLGHRGAVEHDDALEAGQVAPPLRLEDLVQLSGRRHEHRDRLGIAQDVFGLLRGERRVNRNIRRAGGQAGVIAQRPFRAILRDDGDPVTRLDAQLAQAEGDRLDALERLAVGDGHPRTTHLRSERRREAGVPIHRGEEQLVERAFHGPYSTTKRTGLPAISVPSKRFMVAVTTTESALAPGRIRSRTAAMPADVSTVSFGTNVTTGPVVGKVVATYTTRRRSAVPPVANACTWSGIDRESRCSVESGVNLTISRVALSARTESRCASTVTDWGFEKRLPVRASSRPMPTAFDSDTPVVLSRTDRKSTRLNSSHSQISYAVFCLKKKNADLKRVR